MLETARRELRETIAAGAPSRDIDVALRGSGSSLDEVNIIAFAPRFAPIDARALSRRVRRETATGTRSFVIDLMDALTIAEGPLVLSLLSVRADLRRSEGRLVVAAATDLVARLTANLRFDDHLGAARSRTLAIADAAPVTAERGSGGLRCERCAATWHVRGADPLVLTATCRRCGGRLNPA